VALRVIVAMMVVPAGRLTRWWSASVLLAKLPVMVAGRLMVYEVAGVSLGSTSAEVGGAGAEISTLAP
jgi:hypothetical protein